MCCSWERSKGRHLLSSSLQGDQAGPILVYAPLMGVQSRPCLSNRSLMVMKVSLDTANGGYQRCLLGPEGLLFFHFLNVSHLSSVAARCIILEARHDVLGGGGAHLVLRLGLTCSRRGRETKMARMLEVAKGSAGTGLLWRSPRVCPSPDPVAARRLKMEMVILPSPMLLSWVSAVHCILSLLR